MAIYNKLEIKQERPDAGIDVLLDGEPVKGCTDATLSLAVDCIPRLTLTVLVAAVDIELASDVDATQYEKELTT